MSGTRSHVGVVGFKSRRSSILIIENQRICPHFEKKTQERYSILWLVPGTMADDNAILHVNWLEQPASICQYVPKSVSNHTINITSPDLADPDIAGVGVYQVGM